MLSALLIIPMVGAAIVGFFPLSSDGSKSRQITLFFTALSFGWSLYLLQQFNLNNPGFQFQEYLPWADAIGLSYSVGVDGFILTFTYSQLAFSQDFLFLASAKKSSDRAFIIPLFYYVVGELRVH